MNLTRRAVISSAIFSAAGLPQMARALEEKYPTRPIRIIVPFAAGGETDYLPRLVGQYFAESNGVPFVIENRTGGGSVIGIDAGAKAAADGYTLTVVTNAFAVNQSLRASLPYNMLADFVPITRLATSPHVLVVSSSFKASTLAELNQLAKSEKSLSFASVGVGSIAQLEGEKLKREWGVDLVHIPHRGTAPALTDIPANNITMMFAALPPLMPLLQSGQLKPLVVTGHVRDSLIPDTPTMIESGFPDFVFESWYGLIAPRQTPSEYRAKLNSEVRRILGIPSVIAKLREQGFSPSGESAEEFQSFINDEVGKYQKLIDDIGIPKE